MSLVSHLALHPFFAAGLTYFLTTVLRDGDLGLIEHYLEAHPECEHILAPLAWEREKRTHDVVCLLLASPFPCCCLTSCTIVLYPFLSIPSSPHQVLLCFQCLEQILLFTASPPTPHTLSHSPGTGLVQAILKDHMRPIYSSLATANPNKLIAACVRVLTAMVAQGNQSARDVQLVFNFGYKPLGMLCGRTHTIQVSYGLTSIGEFSPALIYVSVMCAMSHFVFMQGTMDTVRLCFVKFMLSFLVVGDGEVIKNLLELKGKPLGLVCGCQRNVQSYI